MINEAAVLAMGFWFCFCRASAQERKKPALTKKKPLNFSIKGLKSLF